MRGEELPGIRVRDNVVVPWWCEGDSGLLVLRGVPRPTRAGLGEALALAGGGRLAAAAGRPRWHASRRWCRSCRPRPRGSSDEAARQLERLKAAAPAPTAVETGADAARIGELEASLAKLEQDGDSRTRELAAAHNELERARGELEKVRNDLETSRRERETAGLDLAAARQQSENARRELAAAVEERRTAERDLDVARRELASRMATPPRRAETPTSEMPAVKPLASGERASAALGVAIAAVRRAAFVPPLLRVSMRGGRCAREPEPRPARRHGVALLDRDVVSLEPVAAELEQAGVEVRLANQPEELALLLRTPDASTLDAVVCDVMSFRPDQNVAGLLRGWDKDRPGLSFFLSYDAQSPVELERARRTPMSLTAGHIQRPLDGARLVGDAREPGRQAQPGQADQPVSGGSSRGTSAPASSRRSDHSSSGGVAIVVDHHHEHRGGVGLGAHDRLAGERERRADAGEDQADLAARHHPDADRQRRRPRAGSRARRPTCRSSPRP